MADYELPVMEERFSENSQPPPDVRDFCEKMRAVDGLVIVSPEYKNAYPGALKNALDYLDAGILATKPVAISTVSSGGFGGLNCLAQLRLVCLALGGLPIPASLPVSKVQELFDDRGTALDERLTNKAGAFLDELIWYTEALSHQRGRRAFESCQKRP